MVAQSLCPINGRLFPKIIGCKILSIVYWIRNLAVKAPSLRRQIVKLQRGWAVVVVVVVVVVVEVVVVVVLVVVVPETGAMVELSAISHLVPVKLGWQLIKIF